MYILAPPTTQLPNVIKSGTGQPTTTAIPIEINTQIFTDDTNGKIVLGGVAACKSGNCKHSVQMIHTLDF